MEIYVPDKWAQEFSIQPGYYEKVIDVIDALRKAGPVNLIDVVVTYDDTSKRVTVRCVKGAVLSSTFYFTREYIKDVWFL